MSQRKFRVLSESMQQKLYSQYGSLGGLSHGWLDGKLSCGLTISYFDHWLSDSECGDLLDNVDPEEHEKRINQYCMFLDSVSKAYKVYSYRILNRKYMGKDVRFREFSNIESMKSYFRSADYTMGKSYYPRLVIPECNAAIHEAYYYSSNLGFKSHEDISELIRLVESSGLNILNWND